MEPLSEETVENWKQVEAKDPVFAKYPDRPEKVPISVITTDKLEDHLVFHKLPSRTGISKVDFMNKVRHGKFFVWQGETADIHNAESMRVMTELEAARDEDDEEYDDEEEDE